MALLISPHSWQHGFLLLKRLPYLPRCPIILLWNFAACCCVCGLPVWNPCLIIHYRATVVCANVVCAVMYVGILELFGGLLSMPSLHCPLTLTHGSESLLANP